MWAGTPSHVDQRAGLGLTSVDKDWEFERVDGRTHPQHPIVPAASGQRSLLRALEDVET